MLFRLPHFAYSIMSGKIESLSQIETKLNILVVSPQLILLSYFSFFWEIKKHIKKCAERKKGKESTREKEKERKREKKSERKEKERDRQFNKINSIVILL